MMNGNLINTLSILSLMKIQLDRTKRIILLKWLRQGHINTLDMPDTMEGYNYFEELMKDVDTKEEVGG